LQERNDSVLAFLVPTLCLLYAWALIMFLYIWLDK
jgi:hypothetical protein